MNRFLFFIIFFITSYSYLNSNILELKSKHLIFKFYDDDGCFYLENPNALDRNEKQFLFYDNPPTSYISFIVNNKPYSPKENKVKIINKFRVETNRIYGTYRIEDLVFELNFINTNIVLDEADTIIIYVSVSNVSSKPVRSGIKLVFDTYYGENLRKPSLFYSSKEEIKTERISLKENLPDFIFSGKMKQNNFSEGIFIYPRVNSFKPDSVVVANWKKIKDTELQADVNLNSYFRFNDNSNPDAAISVFYSNIIINPNEKIQYGCAISVSSIRYENLVKEQIIEVKKMEKKETNTNIENIKKNEGNTNTNTNITNVINTNSINQLEFTNGNISTIITNTNTNSIIIITNMSDFQIELLKKLSDLIDILSNPAINQNIANTNIKQDFPSSQSEKKPTFKFSTLKKSYTDKNEFVESETLKGEESPKIIIITNSSANQDFNELEKEYLNKINEIQDYYKKLIERKNLENAKTVREKKELTQKIDKTLEKQRLLKEYDQKIKFIDENIILLENLLKLNDLNSITIDKINELKNIIDNIMNYEN